MNCWNAKRRSADFVDGRLREGERARVAAHLAKCQACSLNVEQVASVRSHLRELPAPKVPDQLRVALRVSASRERQAVTDSLGSPWRRAFEQWCYRLDQMMRPITVPATGGVLSTVVLFSALAFTIGNRTQMVNYEVPVMYADRWGANLVPVELQSSVLLTLSLDGKGRITDYAVHDASQNFVGDASRLQSHNIALPDFPSVLAGTQRVNRDISIRFVPIFFQR